MIPKIHYCYFDLVLLIMNYENGPDDRANESALNFFTPMINIYHRRLCIT